MTARPLAALVALALSAAPALADDWSGRTVTVTEAVKLGSKLGGGLVRDGAALTPGTAYAVKSDDGTFLELAGGFIFKSEATLSARKDFPKEKKAEDKDDPTRWPLGTKVLYTQRPETIPFGDRDADGKQVSFALSGIMPMEVRADNGDGWVRVHDSYREGWVEKKYLVSKEDARSTGTRP